MLSCSNVKEHPNTIEITRGDFGKRSNGNVNQYNVKMETNQTVTL